MNFQSHKLPKIKKEETPKVKTKKFRLKLFLIIVLLIVTTISLIKTEAPKQFIKETLVKTIAKDLQSDNLGYTNFLILGTGGEGHDGKDLTDTMMLGSINPVTATAILTSVPRDLYASHPNIISQRINSVYANTKYRTDHDTAIQTTTEIVEDLTDLDIHYTVKLDFQALVDLVDSLGGVTIDNQEAIFDPQYPGPNYTFQTFSLPKGIQTIDGETALKFARSRKSTSDFDRTRRQKQLIFAIKETAYQNNVLSSPEKITQIYRSLSTHIQTNIEIPEMITLAKLANQFPQESIISLPIHDDPNQMGGFLYNPPRSQFNDSYVLLPADETKSQIHTYFNLFRQYPYTLNGPIDIKIFNGTSTGGFAGSVKQILKRFGFQVSEIGNADNQDYQETKIEIVSQNEILAQQAVEAINQLLQVPPSQTSFAAFTNTDQETTDFDTVQINITLGQDLVEIMDSLDVYSSLYTLIEQAIRENREAQQTNLEDEASTATTTEEETENITIES